GTMPFRSCSVRFTTTAFGASNSVAAWGAGAGLSDAGGRAWTAAAPAPSAGASLAKSGRAPEWSVVAHRIAMAAGRNRISTTHILRPFRTASYTREIR